ncbi:MarR family winged helix-turn-helix transcriptional regulator [Lacisediminimonas profundi]|uniref:MarR family winged helix-turn-helix transcriptional regulator n=1 Tax=Lacisediminimonas profundi TaxID=2603856 RepID=UPI00124AEE97|nr:MarR family transcriptional regulator [Lacisediminimonas profundi]
MIRPTKTTRSTKPASEPKKKTLPARSASRAPKKSSERTFTLLPTVSKPELLDEDGTSDRNFRQFLYDFSSLANYLASARAYLAERLGVTSPQYNILMIIAQYQGASGVSGSDVAQHMHVTTAFITSEVRKLEAAGLVEKRPNPNDGRSVLLRLTPAAKKSVERIAPERLFVNDQLFRALSGEDFRHLASTVASLIDDFSHTVDLLKTVQRGRAPKLGGRK